MQYRECPSNTYIVSFALSSSIKTCFMCNCPDSFVLKTCLADAVKISLYSLLSYKEPFNVKWNIRVSYERIVLKIQ